MAKLNYITTKSALETLEGKYTGLFLSNGSVGLDELAEKICKDRPAIDAPEVKLAVRALAAEVKREVAENLNYVTTGTLCAFAPAISGSLPSMDAELTAENGFYVNVTPLATLSDAIGRLTPARGASDASKIVLDDVADSASKRRGIIVGTREFVLTGHNLSSGGDGESVKVLNADGTVAAVASVKGEDGCGQRITAQLDEALPAGGYVLQLATRGYATPDADVETYAKKVQVLDAE